MKNDSQENIISFFKKSNNSRIQEKFAEYCFLKDLIFESAFYDERIDIARSDVDTFGYDLIISKQDTNSTKTIFVQLKARRANNNNPILNIHSKFIESESARIILIRFKDNPHTPEYYMYKKTEQNMPKKKKKDDRCSINLSQLKPITGNLFELFK